MNIFFKSMLQLFIFEPHVCCAIQSPGFIPKFNLEIYACRLPLHLHEALNKAMGDVNIEKEVFEHLYAYQYCSYLANQLIVNISYIYGFPAHKRLPPANEFEVSYVYMDSVKMAEISGYDRQSGFKEIAVKENVYVHIDIRTVKCEHAIEKCIWTSLHPASKNLSMVTDHFLVSL